MRIKDRIATKILEGIADYTKKNFKKEDYLNLECMVADLIQEEIKRWLGYDTDFSTFEDEE